MVEWQYPQMLLHVLSLGRVWCSPKHTKGYTDLVLHTAVTAPERDKQKLAAAAAYLDARVGNIPLLPAQCFERFLASQSKAISF